MKRKSSNMEREYGSSGPHHSEGWNEEDPYGRMYRDDDEDVEEEEDEDLDEDDDDEEEDDDLDEDEDDSEEDTDY